LPNQYERIFKEELWGCFKYIGIPMDTLMNMPIADRKFYIMLHNKTEGSKSQDESTETDTRDVDKFNMMQQVKDWH
jgi:hypothetical protein